MLSMGSSMYDMTYNRSDMAHVLDVVDQFLSNLEGDYWSIVEWIMRYL